LFRWDSRILIHTETQLFRLEEANEALACLQDGRLQGATVLSLCEKQMAERGKVGRAKALVRE
jgi:hypothetical protein